MEACRSWIERLTLSFSYRQEQPESFLTGWTAKISGCHFSLAQGPQRFRFLFPGGLTSSCLCLLIAAGRARFKRERRACGVDEPLDDNESAVRSCALSISDPLSDFSSELQFDSSDDLEDSTKSSASAVVVIAWHKSVAVVRGEQCDRTDSKIDKFHRSHNF